MTSPAKLLVAVTGCFLSLGCGQALAAQTSELFVQQLSEGRIDKVGERGLRLTLTPAPGRTIAFSDRPGRQGRTLATKKFVSSWTTYGFGQDPPNAALSIDGSPKGRDVFLLTLKRPRLRDGNLTYTVTPLKGESGRGLERFAKRDDRVRKLKFGEASLFIDPTNQSTPISLSLANIDATGSIVSLAIDPDCDLVWSTSSANGRAPGLVVTSPTGQSPPFVQFSLNSKQMTIVAPPSSTGPANFNIDLYLTGSSSFFEGSALVGQGWSVVATIGDSGSTIWSSGELVAPLYD